MALLFAASNGSLVRKAWLRLSDLAAGAGSGLHVWPQHAEVPVGSDLSVAVAVNRWERRLEAIVRSPGAPPNRFPVVLDESGTGKFRLYDVREPTRFDLFTPSLESRGHTVDVFIPPELRAVEVVIRAPAYARLPERRSAALDEPCA